MPGRGNAIIGIPEREEEGGEIILKRCLLLLRDSYGKDVHRMRIEKCSDSEIHCFLSREDLEARNLRLDELAYGSPRTMELIGELMRWASFKFNFNSDHTPLMVEAIPVSVDSLLLIVKKVPYPDEFDSRFSDFTEAPGYDPEDDDWDDDYDDWDDDDGSDSAPRNPVIPEKPGNAHEIIAQFQQNAEALKAATDAINRLAESAIQAAGGPAAGSTASGSESTGVQAADNTASGHESTGAQAADNAASGPESAGVQAADNTASGPEKAGVQAADNAASGLGNTGGTAKADAPDNAVSTAPLAGAPAPEVSEGTNAPTGAADDSGNRPMTPEGFVKALQSVMNTARKSGSLSNYVRMFRFNSIDDIIGIAPFISSFYKGQSFLYREGDIYHLIVTMDQVSPLDYNKLINILNEFAVAEPITPQTTSFMDEHENLILSGTAFEVLANMK